MSDERKHAALPLVIRTYQNYQGYAIYSDVENSGCVAERWEKHAPIDRLSCLRATGEFIVLACNSHYELLAACQDALATNEKDMQPILDNGRLRDVLKAAIAKATGKTS